MKKILCMLVMVITVVGLSGCGEDANQILKDTASNMQALDNSSMAMTMDLTMESDGSSLNLNTNMDGKVDYKNIVTYFKTTVGMMGFDTTTEVYTEQEEDGIYTYTSEDGKTWTKEIGDINQIDVKSIINSLDSFKKVNKVVSDESGLTKLEITIDKDKINDIISMAEDNVTSVLDLEKDIIYDIYISKDNYVKKIVFDLSDYIQSDEKLAITKFKVTITFDNFNKVGEVVVPDEIKNNAILDTTDELNEVFDEEY